MLDIINCIYCINTYNGWLQKIQYRYSDIFYILNGVVYGIAIVWRFGAMFISTYLYNMIHGLRWITNSNNRSCEIQHYTHDLLHGSCIIWRENKVIDICYYSYGKKVVKAIHKQSNERIILKN